MIASLISGGKVDGQRKEDCRTAPEKTFPSIGTVKKTVTKNPKIHQTSLQNICQIVGF